MAANPQLDFPDLAYLFWFQKMFTDEQPFPYVGNPEMLLKALDDRGTGTRIIEAFFAGGTFRQVIKIITGVGLPADKDGSTQSKGILAVLADERLKRPLIEKLRALQQRLRADGRHYFKTIERPGASPLLPPAALVADSLVCVSGCVTHASTIEQYYPQVGQPLRGLDAWLMTDLPPAAIRSGNSDFHGNFLYVKPQAGTKLDQNSLPFASDIGWYPFVRVTGYFRVASSATAGLPAVELGMVEYKPPLAYTDAARSLADLLRAQSKPGGELATSEARLLATYLAPWFFRQQRISAGACEPTLAAPLKALANGLGSELPQDLEGFYRSLP